ncbi:TPA: FtsK/SpoIIIE domain-containing protein [Enterococcus faecalis]
MRGIRLSRRGSRLRLWHVHLLLYIGYLLWSPTLLLLGVYHFFRTYPLIKNVWNGQNWLIFMEPLAITIGFSGLTAYLVYRCIKKGKQKTGFLYNCYKKQLFAEYLKTSRYVQKKEKKTDKGKKIIEKFPKIYVDYQGNKDIFTFALGNEFQDKFLTISKPIEDLFLGDLIEKTHTMGWISYTYLMDNIHNRINFEDVKVKDGRITLMKGVTWDYRKLPHMLVAGGTGGGKTMFLYSLINAFGQVGRVHIADPKKSDLSHFAKFPAFKGLVVAETKDIFYQLQEAVELMDKRFIYMLDHPDFALGKDFQDYGMCPEFYVIDELASLMSEIENSKEKGYQIWDFYELLTQLVLKGRQAGLFLIIATQRPGTDVLKGSIRDNLFCRVSLGSLSEDGYAMLFGANAFKHKSLVNKTGVFGRGYIDVGTGILTENYSPLLSDNFDAMKFWQAFPKMNYTDVSHIQLDDEKRRVLKDLSPDIEQEELVQKRVNQLVLEKEQLAKKAEERLSVEQKAGLMYS